MAKRRRKSRGCFSIMMLIAACLTIVIVCGFMLMIWCALLLDPKDDLSGNCHFAAASSDTIAGSDGYDPFSFNYLELSHGAWLVRSGDQ